MRLDQSMRGRRKSDFVAVLLASLLAGCLALLLAYLLEPWESAAGDLRMRLRYRLMGAGSAEDRQHTALVAIDSRTQDVLGRYGAGRWVSRLPFVSHLEFFERYLSPTVLAYDVVFLDSKGVQAGDAGGAGSIDNEVLGAIGKMREDPDEPLTSRVLDKLGGLLERQGHLLFANGLASVMSSGKFQVVAGYSLSSGLGGGPDGIVPRFSAADVAGPDGDEERGGLLRYLKYMSIPLADVEFSRRLPASRYGYAVNATAPSGLILDYTLLGCLNGERDSDTVVRRVPLVLGVKYANAVSGKETTLFVPSISLLSVLLANGVQFPLKPGVVRVELGRSLTFAKSDGKLIRVPIDEQGRLFLNYKRRLVDYEPVSFVEFVRTGADRGAALARLKSAVDGRIAVVATVATGVDTGACPIESNTSLVLVHLTAIENLMSDDFLVPVGRVGVLWLGAGLFLVMTVMSLVDTSSRLAPKTALLLMLYLCASYAGVHWSLVVLPVLGPALYVGGTAFMVLSYRFWVAAQERRRVRGMFATMVSDQVLRYMEEKPDSFSLTGRNAECTVFFSDIAGFTSVSEHLAPEQLTRFLNTCLTPVTDCILRHNGYLDKYIGDGVMAVWGVPFPQADHAVLACRAALEQQRIVKELNATRAGEFGMQAISVRMGIASGTVAAGNMGSERKFQYTVIGDTVNLAARLEPANKDFGTRIIVSDGTCRQLGDEFVLRPLGRILVAGKARIVEIHELIGLRGEVAEAELELIGVYAEALRRFYLRDWDGCIGLLDGVLARGKDGAASHLQALARGFRVSEPGAEWKGEYMRQGKG